MKTNRTWAMVLITISIAPIQMTDNGMASLSM